MIEQDYIEIEQDYIDTDAILSQESFVAVVSVDGECLVRVHNDGRVEYGRGYDADADTAWRLALADVYTGRRTE